MLVEVKLTDIVTSDQSMHLGEEDDIDQVRTKCPANKSFVNHQRVTFSLVRSLVKYSPKTVDGWDCERIFEIFERIFEIFTKDHRW